MPISRQRLWRVLVAVLALLFAIAYLGFVLFSDGEKHSDRAQSSGSPTENNRARQETTKRAPGIRHTLVTPSADVKSHTAEPRVAAVSSELVSVDVRILDAGGAGVSGIEIDVDVLVYEKRAGAAEPVPPVRGAKFVADDRGVVRLSVAPGSSVYVMAVSDGAWFFSSVLVETIAEDRVVEIVAAKVTTVEFEVEYADGVPFTGTGWISPSREGTFIVRDGHGVANGVVMGEATRVTFLETRPGFDTYSELIDKAVVNSGVCSIVIPTSKSPNAWLEVDLGALKRGSQYARKLFCIDSGLVVASGNTGVPGDGLVRFLGLLPGKYILSVFAGIGVYRSDVLELVSGTVLRVVPQFERPASVRAMILDSEGKPLSGAVLRVPEGSYADFPAEAATGVQAVSARDGAVVLGQLPASVTHLEIDAAGFEPIAVSVVLNAGGEVDLGVFKLDRAAGAVEVRVVNRQQGKTYSVALLYPGGSSGIRSLRQVDSDGMARFQQVSRRRYSVILVEDATGAGTNVFVDLRDLGSPPVTELDCNKLNRNASYK